MGKILVCIIIFFKLVSHCASAYERPNTIKVMLQNSTVSLDPAHIQDISSLFVSRQINCQLVRNVGSAYYLDAAESIKYLSPLEIIVIIRDDAYFQDGTKITSNDVLASFNHLKKSRSVLRSIFMWIDNVAIVDNKTIKFKLKKPIPKFLTVLSSPNYAIFKSSFIMAAEHDNEMWNFPIGCGGYKITNRDNNVIHLMPVKSGLPIDFYFNQNNNTSDFDIVMGKDLSDSTIKNEFNKIEIFDPSQVYLGLNLKRKIWKDKSVRCDFLSKLNISELISTFHDYGRAANDYFPSGTLGYDASNNYHSSIQNIGKSTPSKKINSICLSYLEVSIPQTYLNRYALMFKYLVKHIKINRISNSKKFGVEFSSSNCDLILFSLKSNYLDGYEYLQVFGNNDANFTGISIPKLKNEIDNSQDIGDANEKIKIYRQAVKYIENMCVVRPIITLPMRSFYVKKNLRAPGIGLGPLNEYYLGAVVKGV